MCSWTTCFRNARVQPPAAGVVATAMGHRGTVLLAPDRFGHPSGQLSAIRSPTSAETDRGEAEIFYGIMMFVAFILGFEIGFIWNLWVYGFISGFLWDFFAGFIYNIGFLPDNSGRFNEVDGILGHLEVSESPDFGATWKFRILV